MICSSCINLDYNGYGQYCMISDCSCPIVEPKKYCVNYEPEEDTLAYLKSVNWVLRSLNLMSCHVVIRKRGKLLGQTETLGGGSVADVISRYGSMTVESTDVIDNILYLYVK